jgi:signal transduction histidine kinase
LISKKNTTLKLISIQDIRTELEARELESYRKLISVMTHEIMNLLTPLTTAAREVHALFNRNDHGRNISQIDETTIKKAMNGLTLIDEQSTGLINFVNNYRKISKLPLPVFTTIDVEDWVEQLKIVYDGRMKESLIHFSIRSEKTIKQLIADKNLLNQVIINLINNSFDAVMEIEKDRKIDIQVLKSFSDKILIKITNNGPLIPLLLQEKIFVPFFTTKKNGSGIGLSISQEIIKMHNGSLSVVSNPENQTCFIIEF